MFSLSKISKASFSVLVNTLPIPNSLKLTDPLKNQIYDTETDILANYYHKQCYPHEFEHLSSLKKFTYLTLTKEDVLKIKKATEQLHKLFHKATQEILKYPSFHSRFNISRRNWEMIKNDFERTKHQYYYGRMDLGFNEDFSQIKIFEYNTGLCGDIYDTTYLQEGAFSHFVENNPFYNDNNVKTIPSGKDLILNLGLRWETLLQNCKNKTIYFIYSHGDKEELLVLNCFFRALELRGIKYKLCSDNHCCLRQSNGKLYDGQTGEEVDLVYKTHPWFNIFSKLKNKDCKCGNFYKFCLNKSSKIVEPMWKTVMGNKALLPFIYEMNKNNPYLIPSSYNINDPCFGDDEFVMEKGLVGRGSMMTKVVQRDKIKSTNPNYKVIYQKIFKGNRIKDNYYIMGSWIVGEKYSGCFIKKSPQIINEYNCSVVPVRILL
jgi:glutathionylspermidine synthase